jgi:hypothetical protein
MLLVSEHHHGVDRLKSVFDILNDWRIEKNQFLDGEGNDIGWTCIIFMRLLMRGVQFKRWTPVPPQSYHDRMTTVNAETRLLNSNLLEPKNTFDIEEQTRG